MKSFRRSREAPTRCRKRRTPPTRSQAKPGPRRRIEPASRTAFSAGPLDFGARDAITAHDRCKRQRLRQVASRIRQDHGAHGLVVLDVTGAATQVAVERLGDGLVEVGPRDRLLRQTLEQNLPLVQETGGTVAALKSKMRDERLLQNGKLAVLGVAFHRADRLAVEACRRNDAGGAGVAGPVRIIDDDRATQALRGAAAKLGAGHPEILAQEIVHRQLVAHLARAVGASIDGDGELRHLRTPLIMAWVTGKDRKRWPVASQMALRSAGTTGIMLTSAMPFGCSAGSTGGNTSISRSGSGRSEPRATRYWPRFHFPLPGPSSKSGRF